MKHLKIEFEDESYTCGDGCCTDYFTYIKVNGEELDECYAGNSVNAVKAVLEHLGYTVEIDWQ